jgi:argininosuccinate lyase
VHLNIEARLTTLVGDAGKRLHTGRSRNDQVATDIRLWLRGEIDAIARCCASCSWRWSRWPSATSTSSCPASPTCRWPSRSVLPPPAGLCRDVQPRRRAAGRRAQARQPLPLGAAALAGTTYPLDRERVARTLGMEACARTAWTR